MGLRWSLRISIAHLMLGVVLLAFSLGILGIPATMAVMGLSAVVGLPAAMAPPGRRLEAASWGSLAQPAVIVLYLYAAWITAWCVLGHRPRPSLDDPKYISAIVEVPYIMFAFSLMFGWMACIVASLALCIACIVRRRKFLPIIGLLVAWVLGYLVLYWDPLGVLYWFMD